MPRIYTQDSAGPLRSLRRAAFIGIAARLLGESGCIGKYTAAQLMLEFGIPHAFGQAEVVTAASGTPVAIVTWAWLSEPTMRTLHANPSHSLHMSELNEGQTLCISGIYRNAQDRDRIIRAFVTGTLRQDGACHVTDTWFGCRRELFVLDMSATPASNLHEAA